MLLIDTDLRKGRIHKIFGIKKPGITEVLGQQMVPDEAVQAIPEVEKLDVLTRGDTPPNPSELLMTPSLGETLKWASGSIRYRDRGLATGVGRNRRGYCGADVWDFTNDCSVL